MPSIQIRILGCEDAPSYHALRLEGLQTAPTAFSSSYEDEAGMTTAQVEARLVDGLPAIATFGAFVEGRLVGMASHVGSLRQKTAHRAMLAGMFVTPAARGRGVAKALLEAVLAYAQAQPQVEEVYLGVTAGNATARAMYERAGFVLYMTEPRYLKIDGQYYDMDAMVLRLDKTQS